MADAPKKTSSSGKGLTKKAGPLPVWGWFAFAGGGFLVYRFIKARQSAGAVNAASGTTGGDLIPNDIGLPSSTGGTTATFTSVGAWTEALLENLTQAGISPGDAYTAAQAYLNGTCVTQGAYNAIAAAILSPNVGLPPGFYSPPSLSVCPTATTTTGTTTPSSGGGSPVATVAAALTQIDATAWPKIVAYGTDANAGTDFTEIGVVNNGQYQGKAAKSGAPVWAGVDGGYAQGFNLSTLPNGTILYGASALAPQGYYA